jgi:predicted MPP superfamily phosphohydrolase
MQEVKINKKITFFSILALCLFIAQLIYVYAFFIEPNWIMVKNVRIKNHRLAQALKNIKVVQISDLHIAKIGFLEMSLIEKINSLKPDILLITGDFIDTKAGMQACWDLLSLIEVKNSIYAIYGNIDDIYIADLLNDPRWKKAGVIMLNDRAIKLNLSNEKDGNFWLAGIHKEKDAKTIIDNIPSYEPIILMCHDPGHIKELSPLGIDLVLSGDTHGGQINPRFIRNIFPMATENRSPYVWGLFKEIGTYLYVNRGIGVSHINARFLCWPEITVFEFAE